MLKILAVCLASLAFGAWLASEPSQLPVRAGYIGAALLIAASIGVKRYWNRLAINTGDEPGAAERNAWLWMTGTALIEGYVIGVLLQPGSEVHTVTGGTGGYDSWVMIAGAIISYRILRDPDIQRDERDVAISTFGLKAGYLSLVMLLTVLLLMLGFAPHDMMQRLTHWLLANTLVTLIMLSCLVQYIVQLACYWRDSRNLRAEQ